MKTISIRFNDYLANWIIGSAQKNRITISEFIRDLLYEKMQYGQVVIKHIPKYKQFAYNQNYRNEMGYIIFTAKLLEKFVLAQPQGEILRNTAFEETENLLAQLKLNGKYYRFCINLDHALFTWLDKEAARLQLKVSTLIRKLIENIFAQKNSTIGVQLSTIQKIAIEHQITACKLLETLVNKTVDDAANVIEEAQFRAKNVLIQLFPEQEICLL